MARRNPLNEVKDQVPSLQQRPESVAVGKRDRRWDEANRSFSFRIREMDAQRLANQAQDLHVSRDALARGLMEAALDALDSGDLILEVEEMTRETEDRLGRFRLTTRRFVRAAWMPDRNGNAAA
jgi:hypothetical protein